MAGRPAEYAQEDATLRTMALGTLILNASLVRAAPGRLIRCRCSAIQNNVQTNTYDPRRPGATPSLLSSRPDFCRAGVGNNGRNQRLNNHSINSIATSGVSSWAASATVPCPFAAAMAERM